jgi:hypothetical protein
VAEKLEALNALGLLNSRMKDFYDLALLPRMYPFEGERLAEAILATFCHRGTTIEAGPIGLTQAYSDDPARAIRCVRSCDGAGSVKRPVTCRGSSPKSDRLLCRSSQPLRPGTHSTFVGIQADRGIEKLPSMKANEEPKADTKGLLMSSGEAVVVRRF